MFLFDIVAFPHPIDLCDGGKLYTTVCGCLTAPDRALMSRFPDARFLVSAAAAAQFPPDEGAEVAFAGRSNAGKSSAINAIAQRHALARTSKAPGRTRLLNFFELVPHGRPGPRRRFSNLPHKGAPPPSPDRVGGPGARELQLLASFVVSLNY